MIGEKNLREKVSKKVMSREVLFSWNVAKP